MPSPANGMRIRLPLWNQRNSARGESPLTASTCCWSHDIVSLSPVAPAKLCAPTANRCRTVANVLADTCPHSCSLHLPATVSGPAQDLPDMLGLGLSHRRLRTPVPPPHVFVHRSQSLHSLHPPSRGGPSTSGGRRQGSSQFAVHAVLPPRLATEKYRINSGRSTTVHSNLPWPPWPLSNDKTLSFQLRLNIKHCTFRVSYS